MTGVEFEFLKSIADGDVQTRKFYADWLWDQGRDAEADHQLWCCKPERTLRRKLQKKAKRRPYGKCHSCGGRTTRVLALLTKTRIGEYPRTYDYVRMDGIIERCWRCSREWERLQKKVIFRGVVER